MSVVGPRPSLSQEVDPYNDYAKQHLLIIPGLTCCWQIKFYRNRLSFEGWADLDVQYSKERSFLTDWKIIFATFGAVLGINGE